MSTQYSASKTASFLLPSLRRISHHSSDSISPPLLSRQIHRILRHRPTSNLAMRIPILSAPFLFTVARPASVAHFAFASVIALLPPLPLEQEKTEAAAAASSPFGVSDPGAGEDDCWRRNLEKRRNGSIGKASSADHGASSRRLSGKKRKQVDILESMADEVHESTVAQKEHVQILANAISGKNDEVKMGEKLAELGFADNDAIAAVLKILSDPRL